MQALRGALGKMTGRLLLSQWVGNIVLMLLAAAWLQIPDSHTWQFAFSVLSAVLLVAGFLVLCVQMSITCLLVMLPRLNKGHYKKLPFHKTKPSLRHIAPKQKKAFIL